MMFFVSTRFLLFLTKTNQSQMRALPRRLIARRLLIRAMAAPNFYPHGLISLTPESSPNRGAELPSRFSNVTFGDLPSASAFVKPASVFYTMDGVKKKRWDVVAAHASVGVVLFHADLQAAIIVRQWRPPVYKTAADAAEEEGREAPPLHAGLTYELCAGILDKDKSPEETAAEEVEEECGFCATSLERVSSHASAIGTQGAPHTIYAATVTSADAIDGGGGGVDGEAIEVLALPTSSIDAFISDDSIVRSAGLMFGLLWLQARLAKGGRVGA